MKFANEIRTASATEITVFRDRRWRKRAAIVAIIWFFTCVFYTAPAALMAALLRNVAPPLQLQNVSGSFWNGSAAQAFWQHNNQTFAIGSVEWHLQPWSLLWLHPSAHIAANYGEQFVDAKLRISPLGHLTLTQTSAALPAALLSNWLPIPARGQIGIKLDRADIARTQFDEVRGALYWQQAQWQWNSHWLALGDYRCALTMPAAQKFHCEVQGQGALAVDGGVDIDTDARTWSLQLQLNTKTSLPDDFRQGMQLMLGAQPDAQGKSEVKRSGRW